MDISERNAIADLQAEALIARTGFSALVKLLAVNGVLQENEIETLCRTVRSTIDIAEFRDEARKKAEIDLHEQWVEQVMALYRDGKAQGMHRRP